MITVPTKFLVTVVSVLVLFSLDAQAQQESFKIDPKSSSVQWIAGKVAGEHRGTLSLSSGSLSFEEGVLKEGSFVANMKSLSISDLKGSSAQNLLNHLKSEDFFAVDKHPLSTFAITKVTSSGSQLNITGNLTIKGITNSITFPATVRKQKNSVLAIATGIKVDRTKYDIKYRSLSFFGEIGDKAIDDEFLLNIKLVGKKG